MKQWKIPVNYSVFGIITIEAETLEKAYEHAQNNIDELPLPYEPEYIDGSYQIDEFEVAELLNK